MRMRPIYKFTRYTAPAFIGVLLAVVINTVSFAGPAAPLEEQLKSFSNIVIDTRGSRGGYGDVASGALTARDILDRLRYDKPITILVDANSRGLLEVLFNEKVEHGSTIYGGKIRVFDNAGDSSRAMAGRMLPADFPPVDVYLHLARPNSTFQFLYDFVDVKDPGGRDQRKQNQIPIRNDSVLMNLPVLGNTENQNYDDPYGGALVGERQFELQAPGLRSYESGVYYDVMAREYAALGDEEALARLNREIDTVENKTVREDLRRIVGGQRLRGAKLALAYGTRSSEQMDTFMSYVEALANEKPPKDSFVFIHPLYLESSQVPQSIRDKVHILQIGEEIPIDPQLGHVYIYQSGAIPQNVFNGLIRNSRIPPLIAGDGAISAAITMGRSFFMTRVPWNSANVEGVRSLLLKNATEAHRTAIEQSFPRKVDALDPRIEQFRLFESPELKAAFAAISEDTGFLTDTIFNSAFYLRAHARGEIQSVDDVTQLKDQRLRMNFVRELAYQGDARAIRLLRQFHRKNPLELSQLVKASKLSNAEALLLSIIMGNETAVSAAEGVDRARSTGPVEQRMTRPSQSTNVFEEHAKELFKALQRYQWSPGNVSIAAKILPYLDDENAMDLIEKVAGKGKTLEGSDERVLAFLEKNLTIGSRGSAFLRVAVMYRDLSAKEFAERIGWALDLLPEGERHGAIRDLVLFDRNMFPLDILVTQRPNDFRAVVAEFTDEHIFQSHSLGALMHVLPEARARKAKLFASIRNDLERTAYEDLVPFFQQATNAEREVFIMALVWMESNEYSKVMAKNPRLSEEIAQYLNHLIQEGDPRFFQVFSSIKRMPTQSSGSAHLDQILARIDSESLLTNFPNSMEQVEQIIMDLANGKRLPLKWAMRTCANPKLELCEKLMRAVAGDDKTLRLVAGLNEEGVQALDGSLWATPTHAYINHQRFRALGIVPSEAVQSMLSRSLVRGIGSSAISWADLPTDIRISRSDFLSALNTLAANVYKTGDDKSEAARIYFEAANQFIMRSEDSGDALATADVLAIKDSAGKIFRMVVDDISLRAQKYSFATDSITNFSWLLEERVHGLSIHLSRLIEGLGSSKEPLTAEQWRFLLTLLDSEIFAGHWRLIEILERESKWPEEVWQKLPNAMRGELASYRREEKHFLFPFALAKVLAHRREPLTEAHQAALKEMVLLIQSDPNIAKEVRHDLHTLRRFAGMPDIDKTALLLSGEVRELGHSSQARVPILEKIRSKCASTFGAIARALSSPRRR